VPTSNVRVGGGGGGGPVIFGAISQSTFDTSGDGTHTVAHTKGASDNVALVFVYHQNPTSPATTGVNYGGSAPMTQVGTDFSTGIDNALMSAYVLANPPSGAQTVTSTVNAGDTNRHYLVVMTFESGNQVTPAGALFTASGTGNTASVTVTGVGANDLVVDFVFAFSTSAPTVDASQTDRGVVGNSGGGHYLDQSTEAGSGSVAMTWDVTGADNWASIALRLIAA
jgi:hypothetical protein